MDLLYAHQLLLHLAAVSAAFRIAPGHLASLTPESEPTVQKDGAENPETVLDAPFVDFTCSLPCWSFFSTLLVPF